MSDVRVTRAELESLIDQPLPGFLDALGDMLERNRIPVASLPAVATVGGGAAIPLMTQRLSEQLRVPIVTLPQPGLAAATGAAVLAELGPSADAPTGLSQARISPRPGACGLGGGRRGRRGRASAPDGSPSATFRALAWSQDDAPAGEPVPYSGEDYTFDRTRRDLRASTGGVRALHRRARGAADPAPLPWYKRPPMLFGAAAAAALLAAGGLAVTLTSSDSTSGPVTDDDTLPNVEVTSTVTDSPTSRP